MLRVDLERREIAASVRDLIERPEPRPLGRLHQARTALGLEVHRQYAAERAGADFEVPVAATFSCDGFEVRLGGRIDGLVARGDRVVVEEVKSVARFEVDPRHALQLRLYMLMLGRPRVSGRLVLVDAVAGARREVDVPFDAAATTRELEELVRAAVAAARHDAEIARRRAAAARTLRFPYPEVRPGQRQLMDAVEKGLETGRPVLAEAPTGTGKTAGALLPALRCALEHNTMLFFATAKRTQQRLVADTVAALGPGVRSLTLRARTAMCPPGTLACHECPLLQRAFDPERRAPVLAGLLDAGHVAPGAVYEAGERARLCPYALALMLMREVDVVIGDVNYVYAPAAALVPDGAVVVVDEAHNLFDRARGYYSPFLRRQDVSRVVWRYPPAAATLIELEDLVEREPAKEAWEPIAEEAARLMVAYVREREPLADDDLLEVLGKVVRIRDLLAAGEPEMLPYAQEDGAGVVCLDPSRRLAERHKKLGGLVAMSATLTPLDHFRAILGLEHPVAVSCPAPFPAEHRCVVVVPGVTTTWRERSRHYETIAKTIERVVAVRPGHYVAYLPSFDFLEAIRERLPPDVLAQARRTTDAERRRILKRFRTDPQPLLLLAVTGGIFAEGIDLPGESLVGAIVVGPGLPQVGTERDAMRRYFDETTGHGFLHAMVAPGMQRVVQAAGRVHRTPNDRGVIVLLDRRFTRRPYQDCLPAHWYRYDPAELTARDPIPVLQRFWLYGA